MNRFTKSTVTAVAAGLMVLAPTVAQAHVKPPVVTETYSWLTTLAEGVTTPAGATDVTWPQTLVGLGDIAPNCGEWHQVDTYIGTRAEIDAVVGDGVLTNGKNGPEDSKIIDEGGSWKFVYGGDCPVVPEQPAPVDVVTVTTGEFVCGDTTVDVTTTTTNVGHVLVDNVWVLNPLPSDRSKTETVTRDLTAEEIASLECAVVPPVEPPVTEEPPVVPPVTPDLPEELVLTGADGVSLAVFGGFLIATGLGFGAFVAWRKRVEARS